MAVLNHISPAEAAIEIKDPVDSQALEQAKAILEELRSDSGKKPNNTNGSSSSTTTSSTTGSVSSSKLLEIGKRLGDIGPDATQYIISASDCKAAFDGLSEDHRQSLVNIHDRVKAFAEAQRKTVQDMEMDIPGGKAGHTVSACRGTFPYTRGWERRAGLMLFLVLRLHFSMLCCYYYYFVHSVLLIIGF